MELKIEYLSKDELKPYVGNAKLHPAEQVGQTKKSIQEFGFDDPIAIWGENEIVEGHGRLLAVMEMPEITTVPVIRLDHLTNEQRRAYALVHNKLTMNTNFDFDLLEIELGNIEMDMGQYGFGEIESLLEDDTNTAGGNPQFNYAEQYGVIVMCADETEQEKIYNRLIGEGYTCRVVAT